MNRIITLVLVTAAFFGAGGVYAQYVRETPAGYPPLIPDLAKILNRFNLPHPQAKWDPDSALSRATLANAVMCEGTWRIDILNRAMARNGNHDPNDMAIDVISVEIPHHPIRPEMRQSCIITARTRGGKVLTYDLNWIAIENNTKTKLPFSLVLNDDIALENWDDNRATVIALPTTDGPAPPLDADGRAAATRAAARAASPPEVHKRLCEAISNDEDAKAKILHAVRLPLTAKFGAMPTQIMSVFAGSEALKSLDSGVCTVWVGMSDNTVVDYTGEVMSFTR